MPRAAHRRHVLERGGEAGAPASRSHLMLPLQAAYAASIIVMSQNLLDDIAARRVGDRGRRTSGVE